ncbi:MAG TPA: hypothetical protein VK447_08990 [Myxococcaceae bacterium]|nr:hypothetical protein [Myxococcaceae bacterium]
MGTGEVDPEVVGEWRATAFSMDVVLRIDADGTSSLLDMVGQCTATEGQLSFKSTAGGSIQYQYAVRGEVLSLSGGDLDRSFDFRRVRAGAPEAKAAPAAATAAAPSDDGETQTSEKGAEFFDASWGVRFRAPAEWRYAKRAGGLLVVSDTEPGLMIGQFRPQVGRAQLEQEMRQPIQQQQAQLLPVNEITELRIGDYVALDGEYAGKSNKGVGLRMRALAVMAPSGSAFAILALTTEGLFPILRMRAEELIRSVRFEAPAGVGEG